MTPQRLFSRSLMRADLAILNGLPPDEGRATDLIRQILRTEPSSPTIPRSILCNFYKNQGDTRFKAGNYQNALEKYMQAMNAVLVPQAAFEVEMANEVAMPVLAEDYYNPVYVGLMGPLQLTAQVDLAMCCNKIASCYHKMGNLVKALEWLQEVDILFVIERCVCRPESFPWIGYVLYFEDHFENQMGAAALYSEIYEQLGNTASSFYFALMCSIYINRCPGQCPGQCPLLPKFQRYNETTDIYKKSFWRHPEPSLIDKWDVTVPELQIRGAWKQLERVPGIRPPSRYGFASWIWKRSLYVAGGCSGQDKYNRDVWCLDLVKMDIWRKLPAFPYKSTDDHRIHEQSMKVWGEKAWLFTGGKILWTFDLVKEKWAPVSTSLPGHSWPYTNQLLTEYAMEIFEDKMYVFGGDDRNALVGVNIFMVLDMKTLKWEYLGGTAEPVCTYKMPVLRRSPASWIVPDQKRLYILFGHAGQLEARMAGKDHGDCSDFIHEDMWSYSIPDRTWRRERLSGSFPSPRTEIACAYNPKLDKVMLYGGYTALDYTNDSERPDKTFGFSFYGDAFMMDPETRSWKHVITRGFPSYRAQAHMLVDYETGEVYLYGGRTNSDFVPSKHSDTRVFGDIWKLCIDLPGGGLEEVDLEYDARSPKMGPWKRCFSCGSTGRQFQKCGGTCGGKDFFCSTDCQREGWAEHKSSQDCRKRVKA